MPPIDPIAPTRVLGATSADEITRGAEKVHIWLDIGRVLVTDPANGPMQYLPGAAEYVAELVRSGYAIGAIVNIPESFGRPGDYDSKLQALKDFIGNNWSGAQPFDWSVFDHVLLPLWDRERKPAPKLFRDAKTISHGQGKVGLFLGETRAEVLAARANGVPGFHVKHEGGRPIYLAENRILDFVESR